MCRKFKKLKMKLIVFLAFVSTFGLHRSAAIDGRLMQRIEQVKDVLKQAMVARLQQQSPIHSADDFLHHGEGDNLFSESLDQQVRKTLQQSIKNVIGKIASRIKTSPFQWKVSDDKDFFLAKPSESDWLPMASNDWSSLRYSGDLPVSSSQMTLRLGENNLRKAVHMIG